MKYLRWLFPLFLLGGLLLVLIWPKRVPEVALSKSPSELPVKLPQSQTAIKSPVLPLTAVAAELRVAARTNQFYRTVAQGWEQPAREPEFAAFQDWVARYLAAAPEVRGGLVAEGMALVQARRAALKELIKAQPERALELVVPSGVRAQLPAAIVAQLEERVTGYGRLEVLAALAEPGREADVTPVWRTVSLGAETYQAYTYGARLGVPTRERVVINGWAVDDLLALSEFALRLLDEDEAAVALAANLDPICSVSGDAATVQQREVVAEVAGQLQFFCLPAHAEETNDRIVAAEGGTPSAEGGDVAASPYTEGQKKLLLIRVDFSDLVGVGLTDSGAVSLINNLNTFYSEMSYGRAGFASNTLGSDFTPVLRMPQPAAYYGTNDYYNQLRSDARAAAATLGYYMTNYNFDVICFGAVPGWGWAGLGYVGAPGAWLRNSFGTGVAGHELGHNYGLNHASYWNTGGASVIGPGTSEEYGDSFDTMGAANAGNNHFNARYKQYLNWLTTNEVVTATSNGTYRIVAHDQPAATGGRGLRVVKNAQTNYWVEFRQKFTGNKWLMSGAGLRWAQNGNQKSQLLDTTPGTTDGKNDAALVIGRTFSDFQSGVHITPVGKAGTTPEALDVVVNLGSFPGNMPPTLQLAASATNVATGAAVTFTATAADSNGDALAYYWEFGDGNFGTNAPMAGKSWAAAGDYLVRCVVTDMKGGQASRWVVVRVGTPTTYRLTGNITQNGSPLNNVRVYVSTTRMGYTDSAGNYAIVGLPAGSYAVNASLEGYSFAAAGFTNNVTVGPDRSGIDFAASVLATDAPAITAQPLGQTVNPGSSVTFSVAATGANPLTYQWRFNGVNLAGATGSSYTRANVQATNAGNYSVVVSNAYGTVVSANATLTVNSPPVITAGPQAQTVIAGSTATFSVTATGSTPLAYQWRRNGTNIVGATASSYTRSNVQGTDAGMYVVVVTNALGAVTSAPASLSVEFTLATTVANGGTVTRSPSQNSYGAGSLVTLTAAHPVYQFTGWSGSFSNSTNPLSLTMGSNVTLTANFASPVPDVIVDNPAAEFTGTWVTETSAADKFNGDYRTAAVVSGAATATATFVPNLVTAGNYDVYVWTPTITRGAAATPVLVAGAATNLNLVVNQSVGSGGWQLLASGVYFAPGTNGWVRLANNANQTGNRIVAADAVRWVFGPVQPALAPFIVHQPTNQFVRVGQSATFSVTASGAGPLTYQWRRNGNPIAAATNQLYQLPTPQVSDCGVYEVWVTNPNGTTPSAAASLLVRATPVIANFQVAGGVAQFQISGTPGDWYEVLGSTNLTHWGVLQSLTNQSGQVSFADPQTAMHARRFYRVRLGD